MNKAVFFDIDGTLIDCLNGITEITPRVKNGVLHLRSTPFFYITYIKR